MKLNMYLEHVLVNDLVKKHAKGAHFYTKGSK